MEDTTQRAEQIGSGLTSRFRSQLQSFNNYSRNRNLTMQGTADAYRQNLIAQAGKTDSGKLINDMMQGQITTEGSASALALSQLGLKGLKSFYGRRLARQKAEVEEARQDVDDAFPEQEEGDEEVGGADEGEIGIEAEPSASNPVVSQGISEGATSTAEDFSGATTGISGVSESGAIQVSSSYTPEPSAEPTTTTSTEATTTSTEATSDIPSGYTGSSQLGLSEEGMAARNTALQSYSDFYSQAPRQVLPTETTTLAETPAGETEAEAGQRLSDLLDTSAEQSANVDFTTGGAMESEAISRGAPTIDYGAGPRALTSTELAKPTPTVQQPEPPRPTEPEADDSPFNPEGGATETSTEPMIDANTHRALTQAAENPNADASTTSATQNVEEVKADMGDIGETAGETGAEAGGLSAEQTAAATGLEAGLEGVEATSGIMASIGAVSSALTILAPLGMLGGLIYEGIQAQKQHDEEQKKLDQASAEEQGEINVEDNESQFVSGRPAFGSMSLAPNIDLKTSS